MHTSHGGGGEDGGPAAEKKAALKATAKWGCGGKDRVAKRAAVSLSKERNEHVGPETIDFLRLRIEGMA